MITPQDANTNGAPVAFLFPGQGSQAVGMGKDLYDGSEAARAVFHEVDRALERPLTKLLFFGPEEELRETVNAQPAIMAVSLACMKAMMENLSPDRMPYPAFVAGHSLGEYTALAASGVLSVGDTARLVRKRGELMQTACDQRPGSMAAIIGLDEMTMEEIARETGTYVSNINTGEQIVVSGERIAVANALDLATARGAKKAIPLKVGGAFHSALMEPARTGLEDAVTRMRFKDARVPIVANCTAEPITAADEIRQELVTQISSCVQWKKSIDYMIEAGTKQFIEVGPGRALSGMVKRIDRSAEAVNVSDIKSIVSLRED